jgi:hypothetical protein
MAATGTKIAIQREGKLRPATTLTAINGEKPAASGTHLRTTALTARAAAKSHELI